MDENTNMVRRDRLGRFVKGCSGNPGGKAAMPPELKKAFREATLEACALLRGFLCDAEAKPELRIKCAEMVFDRVYGKPAQQSAAPHTSDAPQVVIYGSVAD